MKKPTIEGKYLLVRAYWELWKKFSELTYCDRNSENAELEKKEAHDNLNIFNNYSVFPIFKQSLIHSFIILINNFYTTGQFGVFLNKHNAKEEFEKLLEKHKDIIRILKEIRDKEIAHLDKIGALISTLNIEKTDVLLTDLKLFLEKTIGTNKNRVILDYSDNMSENLNNLFDSLRRYEDM